MPFYVITRTSIEAPEIKEKLLSLSRDSAKIFAKQPGLIRMQSLLADNETHVATYMEWEDRAAHLACMESPDFKDVTVLWTQYMEEGKIRFELETYGPLE